MAWLFTTPGSCERHHQKLFVRMLIIVLIYGYINAQIRGKYKSFIFANKTDDKKTRQVQGMP
jgi:hypothetical protein